MDLNEYGAKELFFAGGLPVKRGVRGRDAAELTEACAAANVKYPLVVKALVKTGGRGKAGGIRFAENAEELRKAAGAMLGMNIRGHIVREVMAVEKVEIAREFYLSVTLDRKSKCPRLVFSARGGVDIEQTAREEPESVVSLPVNPLIGVGGYDINYIVSRCGLDKDAGKKLGAVVRGLYALFMKYNLTLCEVNPLALTPSGELMCVDGKVSVDDGFISCGAAAGRAPELLPLLDECDKPPLVLEAEGYNFLLIPVGDGDIAVMSNGSGMIMSCIDAITDRGMSVCCSLDLGGGATSDRIAEAVRIITRYPGVKYLFINIFGGITRCDEVAGGIKKALEEYGVKTPLVVRFEGTNKEAGLMIIKALPVVFADGLTEGVDALKNVHG